MSYLEELEDETIKVYHEILKEEELHWSQRSREKCLAEGENNIRSSIYQYLHNG